MTTQNHMFAKLPYEAFKTCFHPNGVGKVQSDQDVVQTSRKLTDHKKSRRTGSSPLEKRLAPQLSMLLTASFQVLHSTLSRQTWLASVHSA